MILRFTIFILLWCIPSVATSQTTDNEVRNTDLSQILSVDSAVDYALLNNPALKALQEQLASKRAEQGVWYGFDRPELIFAREGMNGNGFAEQRLEVKQTFDFPTSIAAQSRRISGLSNALEAQFEAEKWELIALVKNHYAQVLYTKKLVSLREEQVALAQQIEHVALQRSQVGEVAKIELLQAQLKSSEAAHALDQAQAQYHDARYELFQVMGIPIEEQHYSITFEDELSYEPIQVNQEEVLSAINRHHSLRAQNFLVASAEASLSGKQAQLLPRISASYFAQDFGNGYDLNGFQIGLQIPLWFAVDQLPKIQMATADLRASEYERERVRLDLKKQFEQNWHSFEQAKQQIERYQTNVNEQSIELLELTREAYRVGEAPLLSLLEAQRTYLSTQERYYNALLNYSTRLVMLETILQTELNYAE